MTDLVQKLVGALEELLHECEQGIATSPHARIEARAALSEAKAGGWVCASQAQARPAAVSDAEIERAYECAMGQHLRPQDRAVVLKVARAILALRPQADSKAPAIEAAREMGAKGGPVVESERLSFEAWMAGHCWKVSPTWTGQTYDDSDEYKKRKMLDPHAQTTRMLWAVWRDRAALSTRPQAVPMTQTQVVEAFCATPHQTQYVSVFNAGVRAAEAHHGITAPAGGEG